MSQTSSTPVSLWIKCSIMSGADDVLVASSVDGHGAPARGGQGNVKEGQTL